MSTIPETSYEETSYEENSHEENSYTETLFDSEPWRQAVEQSFELKILSYEPRCETEGRGYYSMVSDIRGERVISTPFSDYCDPQFTTEAGWREFADHLRSYNRPITIRPFTNQLAISDDSFEQRQELMWHGIDLTGGMDPIWATMKPKKRTQARRAQKLGITFRFSSSIEDVATYHAMHVDLRKSKFKMLAQPFSFFEALHDRFGDKMAVILAEDADGDTIAGMIYFEHDGVWYYKFGASYDRAYRPNSAMVMAACQEGMDRGLRMLDLGRSDADQPGLIAFKRQFASVERTLTTLHWRPEDCNDQTGSDVGKTLGAITELLTDPEVPNDVAAQAGALLYRYFC